MSTPPRPPMLGHCRTAALFAALLLAAACASSSTETTTDPSTTPTEPPATSSTSPTEVDPSILEPTPKPTIDRTTAPPAEDRSVPLGESFTLQEDDTAHVDGLRLELVSASGPGDDCQDCPVQATLDVTHGGATERLEFSFSGNMAPGVSEDARTAAVFDHTIRVDRLVDGEADLTVTRS